MEQSGCEPQNGDLIFPYHCAELPQRPGLGGIDNEPGSVEQTPPNLKRGGVERDRSKLQERIGTLQLDVIRVADQPHDIPMTHVNSLGNPSGTGRVHAINKVIRMAGDIRIIRRELRDLVMYQIETEHLGLLGGANVYVVP